MQDLPTIRVKHSDGYAIINVSDFDPKAHELHEPDSPAEARALREYEAIRPAVEAEKVRRRAEQHEIEAKGHGGGGDAVTANRNSTLIPPNIGGFAGAPHPYDGRG